MKRRLFNKKRSFWNRKVNKMTVGDTVILSGLLTILCCLPFVGPLIKELS